MKRYILDTNIILDDANIINSFSDAIVIIPIAVIEELDKFKRNMDNLGRNARHFAKLVDDFRDNLGTISRDGVKVSNDVILKIEVNDRPLPELKHDFISLEWSKEDNRILTVALNEKYKHPDDKVIFLSKDTNLRIKADALGIISENYNEQGNLKIDEVYNGYRTVLVESKILEQLYDDREIDFEFEEPANANEYIIFADKDDENLFYLTRYDIDLKVCLLIDYSTTQDVFGISPRNIEQRIALDLLMNDNIKLVSLIGKAGTGKTLLAIAAGLAKTTQNGFEKMLVSRPVFPMGKDIGYLPGDVDEKLRPWMQPIYDNLELILSLGDPSKAKNYKKRMDDLFNMGIIEVEPLTYIRGRSIPKQYLIVDEAQNLTRLEIKTIVSRAGEGTKIILTGDPYQIDQPYLDATNNGLVYVVEKLKDEGLTGSVTLRRGERSGLAQVAADKL